MKTTKQGCLRNKEKVGGQKERKKKKKTLPEDPLTSNFLFEWIRNTKLSVN